AEEMADTVHVLAARRLTPAQLDQLRAVSPRLIIEQRPAFTAAAVQEALTPETEILLTGRTDFAPEHAPALRWVQLTNAGVHSAHGSALWNSPISITNASGIHAGHLSQYTLAVMLAHAHHLPLAQRLRLEPILWRHRGWWASQFLGYAQANAAAGNQLRARRSLWYAFRCSPAHALVGCLRHWPLKIAHAPTDAQANAL
ncbi:hypothetical protein SE17_39065, partial [Kouleothrix aurantiaca]